MIALGGIIMELLQLRYFCTAARLCNITQAAAYHNIPQPAMSKTISRLERELGVKLFERSKNKIALTPSGEKFYAEVRDSLLNLDIAVQDIAEESQELSGEIRLIVHQNRAGLIDCISEFHKLYPKVTFRVFHEADNANGQYDMCISSVPPSTDDDIRTLLVEEELRIALWADHPLAQQKEIYLSQLTEEDFVFISLNIYNIFRPYCDKYGFRPKVVAITDDMYCIEKYVLKQVGITVAPVVAWYSFFQDGGLLLPIAGDDPKRSTYIFTSSHRLMSIAAQRFHKYLQEYFRNYVSKISSI